MAKVSPNKKDYVWYDSNGKPLDHDPDFRGPIEERSCTDVICCLLFLVFLVGWGFFSVLAFRYGNPERLVYPSDSKGRICATALGGKYNFTDKKFLYFFDLTKCASYSTVFEGCATPQVCIEKCPDYYFSYHMLADQKLIWAQGAQSVQELVQTKMICTQVTDKTKLTTYEEVKMAVERDECAAYVVASSAVLGRCMPTLIVQAGQLALTQAKDQMNNLSTIDNADGRVPNATTLGNAKSFVKLMLETKAVGEKVFADLQEAWWQILTFLCAGALIAFIWIIIMRWVAGIMIWISIVAVVLLLAAGSGFCWYRYYILKDQGVAMDLEFTMNVEQYYEMPKAFLIAGIIFSVLLAIVVILLIFLWKRIQIAISLIIESSKAVTHIVSALFFPILPFVLQLIVFLFWSTIAVYLASWGKENCRRLDIPPGANVNETNGNFSVCPCEDSETPQDPHCKFVNYTDDGRLVFYAQAYNLFAFFWVMIFVEALANLTLAGAFASYYWAFRKPEDVPAMPVLKGFYRAVRYHFGSLAFGSLILAIVKFIRVVLDYIDNKLKNAENRVAKFLMQCLKCCFWCMEKCLKFLTKNAYIVMAIHGNNFCSSAKDAFFLLMRNVARVFVLDKVTDFLLFMGKLMITVGIGVSSFYYFSGKWMVHDILEIKLNYYFVPMIIVTVGTYFICCAFFEVYEMAVDTTFLCFCEDSERNDGSPQKPYFMSKELMKILDKKNEFHLGKAKAEYG